MSEISRVTINEKTYTVKDSTAREAIENLQTNKADLSALLDLNDAKADKTEVSVERERINGLVNQLSGDQGATTLWTGTAYEYGDTITLAEDVANFDYLDFYIDERGSENIRTFNANGGGFAIRSSNLINTITQGNKTTVQLDEMYLTASGTTVTIADHVKWRWTGAEADDATWESVTSSSDVTSTMLLKKVVGRNITENAEVADIRVGADGETYSTAGEAIRANDNLIKGKLDSAIEGGYFNPPDYYGDVTLPQDSGTLSLGSLTGGKTVEVTAISTTPPGRIPDEIVGFVQLAFYVGESFSEFVYLDDLIDGRNTVEIPAGTCEMEIQYDLTNVGTFSISGLRVGEPRNPMQLSQDVTLADDSVTIPNLSEDVVDFINSAIRVGNVEVSVDGKKLVINTDLESADEVSY